MNAIPEQINRLASLLPSAFDGDECVFVVDVQFLSPFHETCSAWLSNHVGRDQEVSAIRVFSFSKSYIKVPLMTMMVVLTFAGPYD